MTADTRPTDRIARVITEISTPALSVVAISVLCGVRSAPGWTGFGWGAAVGFICGVAPYIGLEIASRRRRITDRHVTERSQRPWAFALCLVLVAIGFGLMLMLGAPALLIWAMLTMVAALVIAAVVTALGPKVSMHAMCLTAFFVLAALLYTPWWLLGLALTLPAVAWSRLRLQHHSPVEVMLGAILATVLTCVSWSLAPL